MNQVRDNLLQNSIFPTDYHPYLQLVEFSEGQTICQQGQTLDALYYTLSGKIKIVRKLFNGKEHILDILPPHTLIGDIELLTNQKAVSSVIALEKTQLILLPLTQIRPHLLKDASFLLLLAQGLAKTLYQQNIRASTNISYTVKELLATHILTHEDNGCCQLDLPSLADSFGVSYRHLSRVLHDMTSKGVLKKEKKICYILDRQALLSWQITT